MRTRPRRSILTCLALPLTLPLLACVGEHAGAGARSAFGAGPTPRAIRGEDRYFGVRGKKSTPTGLLFSQTTPDTWAPFDVSIHFGLFDPGQIPTADGVRPCLEVDNVGFSVFYDVCAVYSAAMGGWNLSAFRGLPFTPLPGALFVPGPEVEARIETDGTTLRFHGRAFGSMTWNEFASTPFPAQTEALKAAFGASQIRKGTEVGFDDPSYQSAPPPGPLTPEQEAAAPANAALLAGLSAALALDGASPDFEAAETSLLAARMSLVDAQTLTAALPETKATKKAAKRLAKAVKKLDAALASVDAQDVDRAFKDLLKAGDQVEQAVVLLVPQPIP
jgi:hypothetical protein